MKPVTPSRWRERLLWRLYAGYVVVILISTLIVGVLVSRDVTSNNTQEIERSLAVRAELLAAIAAPALTAPADALRYSELQDSIVTLGAATESRLTIIATDGHVIADSSEQPGEMENHGDRPEIIDAREEGFGTSARFSQTLQQQMLYRAQAVWNHQQIVGYVRVSLALSFVDTKLAQLRVIVLLSATVAALAALIIGFYFARRISAPLSAMTEVADAISQGDYDRRIHVGRRDEVGQLAEAFNRMAKSSAQRMTEITADHSRLTKIFSGMVEGVISVDQALCITHINEAAAKLLELSVKSCISQPIWQMVRVEEINSAMEQAIKNGTVVKAQLRRGTEGEDLVVDIYAAALRSDNDESNGAVIVLHDISELDRLVRVRRDFVANASHELKTPITAIRGLTETIIDDLDMPAATRDSFLQKIHQQGMRLSALVSDLMTISRLESSHDDKLFQPFDLGAALQRSVAAHLSECQQKSLIMRLELPEQPVMLDGDLQAITQLIDNLVDNAIKYSVTNGVITLRLEQLPTMLRLSVMDTGIGISPQHQLRVFERFYRIDKARSRELGGTGLGLSIVKNIAEQHGASVSLYSQPGSGSTFTVSFPVQP